MSPTGPLPAPVPRSRLDCLCEAIAVVLLVAQAFGIVRAAWVPERLFCWSPHDSRADFRIRAWNGATPVDPAQIHGRYGYPWEGTDWHQAANVFRTIEVAESRLPPGRRWRVEVEYRVVLGRWETWHLPAPAP